MRRARPQIMMKRDPSLGVASNGKPLKFKLIKCQMDALPSGKKQISLRGISDQSVKMGHQRTNVSIRDSYRVQKRSLPPLRQGSSDYAYPKFPSSKQTEELNKSLPGSGGADGVHIQSITVRQTLHKQLSMQPMDHLNPL